MKFDLPILDQIDVASPCPASWDEMSGDDRVRFCRSCQLNVYNLSAMTRDEAESLVRTTEERLCARFFRRADGTILTRDCPVGWRALWARFVKVCAAAVGIVLTLAGALVARRTINDFSSASLVPTGSTCTTPRRSFAEWFSPPPPTAAMGGMVMLGDVIRLEPIQEEPSMPAPPSPPMPLESAAVPEAGEQ